MTYGRFSNTTAAVRDFVYNKLIDTAVTLDPPATLNVRSQFANFLVKESFNSLVADEEAERQSSLLHRQLHDACNEWIDIGLPAPIGYADNPDVVLTRKHARYREITGYEPLSLSFIETYHWLSSLGPREFLLPCAVFLKIIGCDPILLTDGPRDEGIDCIGKIADGPMRSIVIFVQAKTTTRPHSLTKNVLYVEYGKYAMLPKRPKYREYLRALNVEKSRDGSADVYFFVTNGEFRNDTQDVARQLGILLRSVRQLAHFLSIHSTPEQLREMQSEIALPSRPDLDTNMASRIRLTGTASAPNS